MNKRDNKSACLNTEKENVCDLIPVSNMQFKHAESLERLMLEASDLVEEIPVYGKNKVLDNFINRLAIMKERVDQYEDFKAKFLVSGSLNVEEDDIEMVTETEEKLNEALT